MIIASNSDPHIGIWWYTDYDEIIGFSCPVDDGVIIGDYVQYTHAR